MSLLRALATDGLFSFDFEHAGLDYLKVHRPEPRLGLVMLHKVPKIAVIALMMLSYESQFDSLLRAAFGFTIDCLNTNIDGKDFFDVRLSESGVGASSIVGSFLL